MKFYFVHVLKLFLSLKKNHYAYTHPYMHKTFSTLGNEKQQQQIKFYEKPSGELIFLQAAKNLKIFYFIHPTEQVLKK